MERRNQQGNNSPNPNDRQFFQRNSIVSQQPQIEKTAENESKKIFEYFCTLNDEQKSINLDFIRKIMTLNKNQINVNEQTTKIITTYHMTDSIKNGKFRSDTYYDEVLNADEFTNFISGQNLKELLFKDDSLDNKRLYTEEYSKLYELMGGDSKGISKENLTKCLILAHKFYAKTEEYLSEDLGDINNRTSSIPPEEKIKEEINEIFSLLSSSDINYISPQDFINIMTSKTPFINEDLNIFEK